MPAVLPSRSPQASDRLLGLLLMTLAPALFWTGCLAVAGYAFNAPVDATTLASIAVLITVFLGAICSALTGVRA